MENKCNTCFYALMDRDLEAPCITCTGYSNYVKGDLYMTQPYNTKPLKEAIDDWVKEGSNGVSSEDFWVSYKGAVLKEEGNTDYSDFGGGSTLDDYPKFKYDTVEKPKHYMLFEEEGIEVRDVIQKLVNKFDEEAVHMFNSHMFIADYVQMMQYLMRFMDKNGVEDLKKARWYLDKLIVSYHESDF